MLGLLSLPAHASINACDEKVNMGVNEGEIVTCDETRNVLFGYNSIQKKASWASYVVGGHRTKQFIRNMGFYSAIEGISSQEQASPREYFNKGYDLAYLVAPYLTDNNISVAQSNSMNNIFPIDSSDWRGQFGDVFWKMNQQEITFAQNKGAYRVITGLHYSKSTQVKPSHIYKIYIHPEFHTTLSLFVPISSSVSDDISQYITSIDCIEEKTNLNLHIGLPPSIESDVENKQARNFNVWSVKDGLINEDKSCAI